MTALSDADRVLLRQVITHARAQGWGRVHDHTHTADDAPVAAEWDRDGNRIVLERWPGGLALDICGMTRIDVVSLRCATDILVVAEVLPVHMSSAYQSGRDRLAGEISDAAETDQARNDAQVKTVLANARTYWLNQLADNAWHLRDLLAGLLDQDGHVARRQADDVVGAVTEVLEAADV